MNIEKIIAIYDNPHLLTEAELLELTPQLDMLVSGGYTEIVENILSRSQSLTPIETSSIINAVNNGHLEMLKLLVEKGYRLEREDTADLYEAIFSFIGLKYSIFFGKKYYFFDDLSKKAPVDKFIQLLDVLSESHARDIFDINGVAKELLAVDNTEEVVDYLESLFLKMENLDPFIIAITPEIGAKLYKKLTLSAQNIKERMINGGVSEEKAEATVALWKTTADADIESPLNQIQKLLDEARYSEITPYLQQIPSDFLKTHGKKLHFPLAIKDISDAMMLLSIFKSDFLYFLCKENRMDILKQIPDDILKEHFFSTDLQVQKLIDLSLQQQNKELFTLVVEKGAEEPSLAFYKNIVEEAEHQGVPWYEAIWMRLLEWDIKFLNKTIINNSPEIKETYSKLLPYLRLAYYQENITREDYITKMTEKLALVFKDFKKAVTYLAKYQSQYPELTTPIHDATLFELPKLRSQGNTIEQGMWNTHVWADLILRLGHQVTVFLPWASIIERHLSKDGQPIYLRRQHIYEALKKEHQDQLKKRCSEVVLKTITPETPEVNIQIAIDRKVENELRIMTQNALNKEIHGLLLRIDPEYPTLRRPERTKKVQDYIRSHDLTIMNYADLLGIVSQHGYARERENPAFARECILAGKTENDFNRCLDFLEKLEDNPNIPDFTIDGDDIGYPGYYLKKLPRHDPLGFILGEKTNCCQSIGNEGEACAIHGMTSPNGGFYVLFQKPGDKIVAQTWAWISEKNNMVFDSIENLKRFDQKMILDFYTAAGNKILEMRPDMNHIAVGMGGNTPAVDNTVNPNLWELENLANYYDYRDSYKNQVIIASRGRIKNYTEIDFQAIPHSEAYALLLRLMEIGDLDGVRFLLQKGIREQDPKERKIADNFSYCKSPLLLKSISLDNFELFKMLLLEFNVDPNVHGHGELGFYSYPLAEAASLGHKEMCELLCSLKRTKIVHNKKNEDYYYSHPNHPSISASEIAKKEGHEELSIFLAQQEQTYLMENLEPFERMMLVRDQILKKWEKGNIEEVIPLITDSSLFYNVISLEKNLLRTLDEAILILNAMPKEQFAKIVKEKLDVLTVCDSFTPNERLEVLQSISLDKLDICCKYLVVNKHTKLTSSLEKYAMEDAEEALKAWDKSPDKDNFTTLIQAMKLIPEHKMDLTSVSTTRELKAKILAHLTYPHTLFGLCLNMINEHERALVKKQLINYGELGASIVEEINCLEKGMESTWPCWQGSEAKLLSLVQAINELLTHSPEVDFKAVISDESSALSQALQQPLSMPDDASPADNHFIQKIMGLARPSSDLHL